MEFFRKENTEWDWQSIIDLLDLKFTTMGTVIWNWGLSVDKRNVAHRCWLLRKYLRDIGKSDDRGSRDADMAFHSIYGFKPEFKFLSKDNQILMPLVIPEGFDESRREEMEKTHAELRVWVMQEAYLKKAIHDFCLEFEDSIRYLWD